MGTFGDIRARFTSVLQYGIFEDVEKKTMDDLIDYLDSLEGKPEQNTVFKVAGKVIPRSKIEELIGKKSKGNEGGPPAGSKIPKKSMTAANLFGKDKVAKADVKISENGIQINGGKIEKVKVPSDERLLEIYGSKEKADLAKAQIDRRNKIIDAAVAAFDDKDFKVVEPVPGISPDTPENREKIKSATVNTIVEGFEKSFEDIDAKPTESQQKILDDFKNLENIKDPEEYQAKLHDITERMFNDPYFDTATADVVEMVTYLGELNKGNQAYMPSESNYPLGDIISMSPVEIDFENDSPEDIQSKMQLIYNGVESRSIKKNAGGASASGSKTELSEFNPVTNKKGETISSEDVKNDLSELSNKDKLYSELFSGDPAKAESKIKALAEKYDFDLDDPKFKKGRATQVKTGIKNASKDCPDPDKEALEKKLSNYYNLGKLYEKIYNDTVKSQLFVNEQYKHSDATGKLTTNRTDGVTTMARLKFKFNMGFSKCNGTPGNTVPTQFKNDKPKK